MAMLAYEIAPYIFIAFKRNDQVFGSWFASVLHHVDIEVKSSMTVEQNM